MSKYIEVATTYKPTPKLGVVALIFSIASMLFIISMTALYLIAQCPESIKYSDFAAEIFIISITPVFVFCGVSLGLSVGACCLPERKKRLPITALALSALAIAYIILCVMLILFRGRLLC